METFQLSKTIEPLILPIGKAEEPVIVIDDVMARWQHLRDVAASQDFRDVGSSGGFPGLRAALPTAYATSLLRLVDPMIRGLFFSKSPLKLGTFDCNFSLVTYSPDQLHPAQKLPHVDFAAENRIAMVHFLCPERFGGTAFYRHLGLSAEQIGPDLRTDWLAARKREMAALPKTSGYPDENTAGYHRIASFAAQPDRLLIYRSNILHSGIIDKPSLLSEDPKQGRLTANFFLDYVAA